jgi:FG-GAP-like repeat
MDQLCEAMHKTLIITILFSSSATAQIPGTFLWSNAVPVSEGANQYALAWSGGINFAQFNGLDLDQDGTVDLVIFDRQGDVITTLLYDPDANPPGYRSTRDYQHIWPLNVLEDWVITRDYDCDGQRDLYTRVNQGIAVYRNTSSGGALSFALAKPLLKSIYFNPPAFNLYVTGQDLPGIVDVDNDGDLDVLTFGVAGSFLEYHQNQSMENYGTCDSLEFRMGNACWGYFKEDNDSNTVTLNSICSPNVANPKAAAHTGSSLLALDLNANGVKDLLLGDVSFPNVVALINGGGIASSLMVDQDTQFPSYDVPVDMDTFPGMFHEDVDHDGKRDLLVSPNRTSGAENTSSVWYYRNDGEDDAPVLNLIQRNLFQDEMLEFGEGAYPVAFDHNGDGLMDLLVANYGYFEEGSYTYGLALLENVGTAIAPAFSLLTRDLVGLSASPLGRNLHPAVADLDADGDQDLLLGDTQGRLHFFRNTGSSAAADFVQEQTSIVDADGAIIDVGAFSAPQLFDVDEDGLIDLLVGEANGNVNYYRNSGDPQLPQWTLVDDELGQVDVSDPFNESSGHAVPCMFSGTTGPELLVGNERGWLAYYRPENGNLSTPFVLVDSIYADIDEGDRSAPTLHDWNADGEQDLVVGNYRGGLAFFLGDEVSVAAPPEPKAPLFSLLPNPASEQLEVRTETGGTLSRNLTGNRTPLSIGYLPCGVYSAVLRTAVGRGVQQLVIVR